MKKILLLFIGLVLLACKKEEQNKPIENTDPKLQTAINILKGDMILGQHVKMAGVDKSLLPSGVPTKFTFTWDDASKRLKMHLEKIQPGTMPFAVTMQASQPYNFRIQTLKRQKHYSKVRSIWTL